MVRLERSARKPLVPILAGMAVLSVSFAAGADTPMSYLRGFGAKADPVVALTWGTLGISVAVVIIICVLLVAGVLRSRSAVVDGDVRRQPVARRGNGLLWIYWGTGVSTVVLFGALVWTVAVLAAINSPASKPTLTIEVTGQQWWWKVRYLSDDPSRIITTANEIHIPVGQPVRVRLIGADVIHSFWIPALSGKTDTIPGQTNTTWIEASKPGIYRGQCTEYCGEQHAHMAAFVVAQAPDAFQNWWNSQIEAAPDPATPQQTRGRAAFEFHCGSCHTVRGSDSGGSIAPDLTHLMSRNTIAAGVLVNSPDNLAGWITNPQAIKPGTTMPIPGISGPEVGDITAYLQTLQ
jgi:cytochrome c oxidase subunit 2